MPCWTENGTQGIEVRAPEETKNFQYRFRGALPDIRIDVTQMVSGGDLVVGCCKIKARMQERALALNPSATQLRLIRCGSNKGAPGGGGGFKRR